jgi:cobalamin biosynthesis protein CobC
MVTNVKSAPLNQHGGNVEAARRRFPGAPEPWIDLSTGINPEPYPVGPISPTAWERLPETDVLGRLEEIAATRYGAGQSANVVAGPGTQALIQWLPRLIRAKRVGVFGFTYSEHARAWREAGANVTTVNELRQLKDFDVAVVVNPNNPDGRLIASNELRELAAALARNGGALVVDEAFMDVITPSQSLAHDMPDQRVVVLRSFGKMYGLAGVRLGFAICSGDLVSALRNALGAWPVAGPAIEIGSRALSDDAWLEASTERLAADAARLDALLVAAGCRIIGGVSLYTLCLHQDAQPVFERLGSAGILVRSFAEKPNWLRFGIPKHETQWTRLKEALRG